MLRGISPLLSPDLLKTLCEMGHGDSIVFADAHFPAHSLGQRTLRADGLTIPPLLKAIAPLFVLDTPGNPLAMMQPEDPKDLDQSLEDEFVGALRMQSATIPAPQRLDRESFYNLARSAYVVLQTGETRPYGNIIVRKGVTI